MKAHPSVSALLRFALLAVLLAAGCAKSVPPAEEPNAEAELSVAEADTSPLAVQAARDGGEAIVALTPELIRELDPDSRFSLGLDRAARDGFQVLNHKRVMLATSRLALDSEGRHIVELLLPLRRPMVKKIVLFNDELPSSGRSSRIDGVLSTYPSVRVFERSPSALELAPAMIADTDIVVLDLPIRPGRFYGEVAFVGAVLRAAAKANVPVLLLDRPVSLRQYAEDGPLGDVSARGSVASYFPTVAVPNMTPGEIATLFNTRFGLQAELEVLPLLHWDRGDGCEPLVAALERNGTSPQTNLDEWSRYVTASGQAAQWQLVADLLPPALSPAVVESGEDASLRLTLPADGPATFAGDLESLLPNGMEVVSAESSISVSFAGDIPPATTAFLIWAAWTKDRPEAVPAGDETLFASQALFDGLRQGRNPQEIIRRWALDPARQDFVERRSEYLLYR